GLEVLHLLGPVNNHGVINNEKADRHDSTQDLIQGIVGCHESSAATGFQIHEEDAQQDPKYTEAYYQTGRYHHGLRRRPDPRPCATTFEIYANRFADGFHLIALRHGGERVVCLRNWTRG